MDNIKKVSTDTATQSILKNSESMELINQSKIVCINENDNDDNPYIEDSPFEEDSSSSFNNDDEEDFDDDDDDNNFEDDDWDDKDNDNYESFDDIVNRFVSKHNKNQIEKSDYIDMQKLKHQRLGKKAYELPPCRKPSMQCSDISLSINNSKHTLKLYGQPLTLEYQNGENEYTFTLNNISRLSYEECNLYIYHSNRSTPIFKKEIEYNLLKETATVTIPESILEAENYILLFDNVGSYDNKHFDHFGSSIVFPLSMFSSDDAYTSDVISTQAKINKEGNELSLRFKFYESTPYYCGYELMLFNSNFNIVAQTSNTAWSYKFLHKRKVFDFTAISNLPLIGKHVAILSINNYPEYCVYLDIKEGKVTIENVFKAQPNTIEHILYNRVKESYSWNILCSMCGYGNAKRHLLNIEMRNEFNGLRKQRGLSHLKLNLNLIYHGSGSNEELSVLNHLILLQKDINDLETGDCIALTEPKTAFDPYEDATKLFENTSEKAIVLYNISALVNSNIVVINKLLNTLAKDEVHSICLVGKESEIEQLFQTYPQIAEYFPKENRIDHYSFTADDFTRHCIKTLQECDLNPVPAAIKKISNAIKKAHDNGYLFGWTLKDIEKFTHEHIIENYYKRVLQYHDDNREFTKTLLSQILKEDINAEILTSRNASPFEESIRALNSMVGLEEIKSSITTTFNRIKISEERKRLGLKVKSSTCNHMLFTGNPGTGKTTVAKMVGKIYHSLGLLSKGEVICADRTKIIGRYIGETERNMQRLLSEAQGNVLFIDEAYTLCDTLEDRKDFGYRAIECLLTVLAQKDSDIIVIFAGYEKEIERMMESNQGLQGRFPYKFNFKDYNAQELTQIALSLIKEEEYELTPEAEKILRDTIADTVKNKTKNFSNARWIEQFVNNGIKHAQSDRLAQINSNLSTEAYRTIEAEDVQTAFAKHKPKNEVVHRAIGFRA